METISILLVDDQSIILDGLESLLEHHPHIHVVGRAANGIEAVAKSNELHPNVVLMDISMPEMDGIEATRALLKGCENSKVLILSMYNNKEFVNELLEAGASGYVLKNVGKDELMVAIQTVADGYRYLAKDVEHMLEQADRHKDRTRDTGYVSLSKREKEVLLLVSGGLSNPEIAEDLFISIQTVETHRKNIMHKLDIHNTAGMVKYAMERGWGNGMSTNGNHQNNKRK